MQVDVSVIVPVYKTERYLPECLYSIFSQTARPIQVICIDDGSPDGCAAILREYAQKYKEIEIVTKSNGGLSSARNAGLSRVRGKYVLFVDSDDWIDRQLCENVFHKAENFDAEIVCFGYNRFRQGRITRGKPYLLSGERTSVLEKSELLRANHVWSRLWKTDFLLKHSIRFPEGLHFEDIYFNWVGTVLSQKIIVVEQPYYYYRNHSDSIVGSKGKFLLDTVEIFEMTNDFLRESGHYEEYREIFINFKLSCLYHHYKQIDIRLKAEMERRIRETLNQDEIDYLQSVRGMKSEQRSFYLSGTGKRFHHFNYKFQQMVRSAFNTFWRNILFTARKMIRKEGVIKK
jgi:glycosyltransferase involved in cell wall biosynthesis